MRTPLCDLLGIEAPVVLAPMGGAVTPTLAAAVSNAGALGMLPLTWTPPEEIATTVDETRQRTEHPFGVNLGLGWDQRERLASGLAAGVRVVSFFWGDASGVIGEAREADTFYGTLFDGGWPDTPHRTLRNSTINLWEQAGRPASGSRPGEDDEPASRPDGSPINRYASSTPTAAMAGDVEPLPHWAGQGVGLVKREESAAEIVDSLVTEAEETIRSLT